MTITLAHAEGNVIEVLPGAKARISGVTLTGMGGAANGGSSAVSVMHTASAVIEETSIEAHSGRVDGSGIFAAGDLTLERSLVDGVKLYGIWWLNGNLTVRNSTFHKNKAGAIWLQSMSGKSATIDHVTFVDNGNVALMNSMIMQAPVDTAYVSRSIFVGGISAMASTSDLKTRGGNVVGDRQAVWGSNDLQSTAALLGPLQDNGGPTRSFMPKSTSPALGLGSCGSTVDQRGVLRPTTKCAAGALEGAACGNGVVESGEECDGTACCSATCSFASAGTACGDATDTVCNPADTCDGAGACLANVAADGDACDNGIFCDGADTCKEGVCSAGAGDPCAAGEICREDQAQCVAKVDEVDEVDEVGEAPARDAGVGSTVTVGGKNNAGGGDAGIGVVDDADDLASTPDGASTGGGGCACTTTGEPSHGAPKVAGWLAALGLVTASRIFRSRRKEGGARR